MASATMLSEADVATQAATLRAELKEWEKAFSAANGGRKAGREDIKKDPTIAAKYKAYSRLRSHDQSSTDKGKDTPTKRTVPLKPEHQESKKRKYGSPTGPGNHHSTSTPRKAARGDFSTPMKGRVSNVHPSQLDPYDSPSTLRRLFSPSTHKQGEPSPLPLKAAIGPTPQRDGKALGLFDLLSASGGSTATPSAQRLATVSGEAMQTPSRKRNLDTIQEEDEEEEEIGRIERTPASSSKKLYLENLFATPTTLRYAAMVEDENDGKQSNRAVPDASTTAAEPDESETPSFLRRIHSGVFTDSSGLSPIAVRKPQQRFVGKGLSALVKGLRDMERDMEAEKAQDDWDVLREMEAEQAAGNDVQVADSQAAAGTGEEATRRPWKKKGQKRTTRRVVMRPVVAKSKPGSQRKRPEDGDENDESEDELKAVSESQPTDVAKEEKEGDGQDEEEADDADSLHTASEPELDDSDSDYNEASGSVKKSSSFSEKIKAALSGKSKSNNKSEKPETEQEKAKKPAARKINPQAHANYRSLKIRNKGSKGKGAGRWGRRR